MNSKDVGTLGESIAITELLRNSVIVSRPIGDNSRYDLILDIKGTLFTCQVKSTATASNDLAEFWLQSSTHHRNGGGRQHYDVDLFVLVDIVNNRVFALPNIDNRTAIKLRYHKGTSAQHFADDYDLVKFLEQV